MKSVITIFFFMLIGLYIGIGGMGKIEYEEALKELSKEKPDIGDTMKVEYRGLTYENMLEMNKADLADDYNTFMKLFSWTERIPNIIGLLITCCGFSLIGSVIWLLRDCIVNKKELYQQRYVLQPMLGFLTGFFVLGITYVLPTALLRGDGQFRPISLMFLSLFAGLFSTSFYDRLSILFEKKILSEK